jgi:4-hydroxy-tetrahydrodipicolinate reductase
MDEVSSLAARTGGTLLHSPNFSLGVILFYKIVAEASQLLADFDEYDCAIWEAHHNQKADSPSGTALEIARIIMSKNAAKTDIVTESFHGKPRSSDLHVSSTRIGSVPGTHTVFFDSAADTIELTHTARSREGFANGAVRALERLVLALNGGTLSRGAVYSMRDLF